MHKDKYRQRGKDIEIKSKELERQVRVRIGGVKEIGKLRKEKKSGNKLISSHSGSMRDTGEAQITKMCPPGFLSPDLNLLAGGYCVQLPPQYCQ